MAVDRPRVLYFKEFLPTPVCIVLSMCFATVFQFNGGVFLPVAVQMSSELGCIQEDVMMAGYASFIGMTVIFPILFRLKSRFTTRSILLTVCPILIVCNWITMHTDILPVLVVTCFISGFFRNYIVSNTLLAVIEGCIRLGLFMLYVVLISSMKDIKRTYMYHGAEHKCINCIERGRELNVKNVRKSSRYHSRCGTSFMFIVMVISIIFFIFIRVDSPTLRVLYRVLLIPVIAGVSYEFIRLAGRSENPVVKLLSLPGKGMQKLTTKEPDDDMIEVAIAAVEAVFDWRAFQGYKLDDEDEGGEE